MNILIVYGGKSCEHDISIITGCLAKGYFDGNIFSAYFTQDNRCFLVPNDLTPKQHKTFKLKQRVLFLTGMGSIALATDNRVKRVVKIDLVVNCCHGVSGEDGGIAALCQLCNLPLVGSDIVSSAVAMDKVVTKQVLSSLGFPVLQGVFLQRDYSPEQLSQVEGLGYPIIVKPSMLGSSIGITVCRNKTQLLEALETAFWFDKCVVCENALENFFELNCAAMCTKKGIETSSVERPYTTNDILTFQDKYQRGEKLVGQPVDIPQELQNQVKALTQQIYRQLNFGGVVRVDYLVDSNGKLFVNEINSIPGSLAYGLWQDVYSPKQFGKILAEQALRVFNENEQLKRTFDSGVLNGGQIFKK